MGKERGKDSFSGAEKRRDKIPIAQVLWEIPVPNVKKAMFLSTVKMANIVDPH